MTLSLAAEMTKGIPLDVLKNAIDKLPMSQQMAIYDDWSLWALPHQRLPEGQWRRWVLRGGRGSGKTFAAAKTVNMIARDRQKIRTGEIGIIARTHSDARFTCVEGPSGILATAPSDFRPEWSPGTGTLVWPNKVKGRIFSADKPEGMRGPNWSFIWADEVCQWPDVERTWWEVIELALRLGWARALLSTTPRPDPFLKNLEASEDTVVTHASTFDNPWLDERTKEAFKKVYAGTRRGQQELEGLILEDVNDALWSWEHIENHRVDTLPDFARIVVAIDPAVTSTESSDETGIIVFGLDYKNHGYVLEDASGTYTPNQWAKLAVSLYHRYEADRIVAETNQGGDMVEATVRAIDPRVSYSGVRATRGKTLRAEPVAALYERGMVHHAGVYEKLEKQLTTWVPGHPSPDRLDALVWASTFTQLSNEKISLPASAYL